MDALQRPIQVTFSYPVRFTTGLFAPSNTTFRDALAAPAAPSQPRGPSPARVLFVVDDGVMAAHGGLPGAIAAYCTAHHDVIDPQSTVLVIAGGEAAKNDARAVEQVQAAINGARLCRHSYVAAIGGGAVLDVVGYAAATAHRGIRLIRVPTTVLAQDDSAVGVKNGINAFGKKNYLGTFAPPYAVLNDFDFLKTLSDRDWRAGIAEAIKVALIRDAAFFDLLEADATRLAARDAAAMERLVRRSAALHLEHIATGGDPFELGSSRPLDFGHWAAHKLEQVTAHRLRHGEAVAVGMALDSTYAHLAGFLPEGDWQRILQLLLALGLDIAVPEMDDEPHLEDPDAGVLGGLEEFREHLGGALTIMLLRGIGRPFDVHEIDRDVMMRSIKRVAALQDAARRGLASSAS